MPIQHNDTDHLNNVYFSKGGATATKTPSKTHLQVAKTIFLSCFVWPRNNGLVKKLSQNADFDLFLKLLYLGGDSNVKTMKEII